MNRHLRSKCLAGTFAIATGLASLTPSHAALVAEHLGSLSSCNEICDDYAAFSRFSDFIGYFVFDAEAGVNTNLGQADIIDWKLEIFNSAAPAELAQYDQNGRITNAATANPIVLKASNAEFAWFVGSYDTAIFPQFNFTWSLSATDPGLSVVGEYFLKDGFFGLLRDSATNSVVSTVDLLTTSDFFDTADSDGVAASIDNCITFANPDQRDTDGDGIGNACDADLDNDCMVGADDLVLFRDLFYSNDENADFSGDGVVNIPDLAVMKQLFLSPPGPSANDCVPDAG